MRPNLFFPEDDSINITREELIKKKALKGLKSLSKDTEIKKYFVLKYDETIYKQ